MSETTLRSVNGQAAVSEYRGTSDQIKQSIAGLSDRQLAWKPAQDKWSVKEIIAHLVDSSLVHAVRIRKIAAESEPPFLLYDQDAWVRSSRSNEASLPGLLAAFDAVLACNLLWYERLDARDWERAGLNNGKEVTIADLFHGFIRHVTIHLAQIERTKAAYGERSGGKDGS
ncbi:DinB superfamily protein [Paenibacillus sp. UNCCL117]|uniref:DinB family protein n=1 Tax=unclassified Paenibacillus TaxID=185978 RepID=UPI00088BB3C2|nr:MULTISPECIES: DinB family protein [unclassified Paenibacillus]SDE28716.1 DinB superfamily protein [Paenibacillus sp. cl123]SFW63415.1 DinB superfamily protein [Paenibacillus sp. UNCCL117]